MAFPVDILDDCSHEDLESSAEDYLADLRCADPGSPEFLQLPGKVHMPISLSMVGYAPLYGGDQTHKVLALFSPEDTLTAVALYLAEQWWAIEDIVRTSNPQREGLRKVQTLGERVVLYVLNRIIYRKLEMAKSEVPFLCHSSTDYAKILWKKGEAVGFYSVKPSGSVCSTYLTQRYQLPVLDTMFVRKRHREKGFGLQMLEDFVDSYSEDALGLRYPISSSTYAVCKQYLEKYPGDHDLLWEVESVGHWFQRTPIANRVQKETIKPIEAPLCENATSATEESSPKSSTEPESGSEQSTEAHHAINDAHVTVELSRNVEVMHTEASVSEEFDVKPVSTRTRSSHLRRPKIGRRIQEFDEIKPAEDDDITALSSSVRSESISLTSLNTEESLENRTEEVSEEVAVEVVHKPSPPASDEHTELIFSSTPEKLEDTATTEQEATIIDIVEGTAVTENATTDHAVSDGEFSIEPQDPDEEIRDLLIPVTIESFETSNDAPSDQTAVQEDLSSEIALEILAIEKKSGYLLFDGESTVESENSSEENVVLLSVVVHPFLNSADNTIDQKSDPESLNSDVAEEPLEADNGSGKAVCDREVSPETDKVDEEITPASILVSDETFNTIVEPPSEQTANHADMEISTEDPSDTGKVESDDKRTEVLDEKTSPESRDAVASLPLEEPSDNGLLNSKEMEAPEASTVPDGAPPDVVPLLKVPVQDALAYEGLRHSSVVVVELKDVSLQHNTEGHKSHSEEQSEESAVEKVAESSSEEAETESPVRERRGLRRKATVGRGRLRKKGKMSA